MKGKKFLKIKGDDKKYNHRVVVIVPASIAK